MLVLSPDSSCDVCMENYMDEAGIPHAISCGHVFCRACLAQMQTQCPLCRKNFPRWDIRKLHVRSASPMTVALQVDAQAQHILNEIVNAGDRNATLEEMQRVVDQYHIYHNAHQQDSPSSPLGVSHLLLSNLLEARRQLCLQSDQLSKLKETRDDLMVDLVATAQKEEALQALNDVWRHQVESTTRKNRFLREELNRLQSTTGAALQRSADTVGDCSCTTIPRRTVVASGSLGMEARRNTAQSKAPPPSSRRSFPFEVLLASVGIVLILRTFSAASKSGGSK